MKQVAVIGLGRFGLSVVKNLCETCEVLAVDIDEKKVNDALPYANYAVQADVTEEETIKSLGLRNFDFNIVAIGSDIQASVIITLSLKEAGASTVISKAQNEMHGKILQKAGADRVVFPERDMGARLARSIISTNVLDFIEISPDYSIIESSLPPRLSGKTIRELDLREKLGLNIIAIKRGEEIIITPKAGDMVHEGDVLVVVGKNKELAKLNK
jgi:trk system potassium uptake protein